ncbi:39S ribosomal protein L42, mitochondrial [Pseudolycoriella hygida]|uniref:Large ribosomal subunit protein mL42 n=1 Tax=Pseudolycoriella hygida TaxID=35572 RepID=A0A9Q0MS95_9DIPT|nr:39S ribosomal protein L42, mitochondrial [Pseudolycoriella hygida]
MSNCNRAVAFKVSKVLKRAMNSLVLSKLFSRTSAVRNIKSISSKTATGDWSLVNKIAVTDDGKMFVAWHPEQEFPHEFTRPIPATYEERNRSAVIKESSINTAMNAFKTKRPEVSRQELQNITFTTKHRWFPRARDKKAKKTPMDREYL